MNGCAYTLFDTALGRCAILWRGGFVVGAALPEPTEPRLRESLLRRFPHAREEAQPAFVSQAAGAVIRLLAGEAEDFALVPFDISGLAEFERAVLEETKRIPLGQTRTYGEIAGALGAPGAARAVGRALGRNPIPIIIPCHRVLAASGKAAASRRRVALPPN